MNHECIKDLSMKISIEFKDQVSRFLSKGYRFGGLLLGIESVQYLPYQSMYISHKVSWAKPGTCVIYKAQCNEFDF